MGCPCHPCTCNPRFQYCTSAWPDTNATRDQRLVPPQRQKDGIRAAEAEALASTLFYDYGDSAHVVGRYIIHVQLERSWRSISQSDAADAPSSAGAGAGAGASPSQAATALTRNRAALFISTSSLGLGSGICRFRDFKQLGRPAVFLFFALPLPLLYFARSFLYFPSLSCPWRTTTTTRYAAQPRTDSRWVSPPQVNPIPLIPLSKPQSEPAAKTRQNQDGVHRRRQGPRP